MRLNRTMRLPVKGLGVPQEFYNKAQDEIESKNSHKTWSPSGLISKFEKVRIKSGKPKSYITF